MNSDHLKSIRDAVKKHPAAFDDRGRFLATPSVMRLIGTTAVSQRGELLRYVDELRAKLGATAAILSDLGAFSGKPAPAITPEAATLLAIQLEGFL